MNKLLKFLDRIGRKRVIPDRESNEPYLTRYYLFLKERKRFPFNVFLHQFHKGDPDDLHDHPWPYITILLRGGYWEHSSDGTRRWRKAGTIRFSGSRSLHRIELDPGTNPWTLFIPGPHVREWGFIDKTKNVWKPHEQYLEERYGRNG